MARKNFIDMVGHRSGRLTVVERGPNKADGTAQWLCKCDCGSDKLTLLVGQNLRAGRTLSCSCLRVEHGKQLAANPTPAVIAYRNRPTPMATCHPDLPQEAKGLCEPCYNQLKRSYNPERDKAVYKARMQKPENKSTVDGSPLRNAQLKYLYKITQEQFDAMMVEQGGVCGACRLPETATWRKTNLVKRLQIDHDSNCCPGKRSCGKCIRGLLCGACNALIGLAKHNPQLLNTLAEYVAAGGYRKMKALEEEVERCIGGC